MDKESCKYCNFKEYVGEKLIPIVCIDGGKQEFQIFLEDSFENECQIISLEGVYTELKVEIKYCPMCGRQL